MSENNLRKEFEDALNKASADELISPEYRKKRLIKYIVRTSLAILIYFTFWEYNWVRWTLQTESQKRQSEKPESV